MQIKMLRDHVLVKPERLQKSAGGILLPDKLKDNERPAKGVVMQTGPGKVTDGLLEPMPVKRGDTILFHHFPHLEIDDREVLEALGEKDSIYIISSKEIVSVLGKGGGKG